LTNSLPDIFDVEDSISAKVAEALALKVSGEEQKRLTRRYTNNAEAYQLYLKGRYFWNKRTEEGFNQGITHFKLAVAKDATYALAYAGLADSYIGLTFYNFAAPHETMPKAKEAAMNALSIDSELAEAHASLAPRADELRLELVGSRERVQAQHATQPGLCDGAPVVRRSTI
jgi:hypothetical protein